MDTTLSQRPATGKVLPARLATATAWLTGLSCVAVVFSIAISQNLLAALASLLLSRQPLDFPRHWRIPLLAFAADYFALQRQGLGFYDNYVVHQITGFMSHWMTYGGQLMIVLLLLLAIILLATDSEHG